MIEIVQVSLAGLDCEVQLYKSAKTVWTADGKFNGRFVQVTSRSKSGAIAVWKQSALDSTPGGH